MTISTILFGFWIGIREKKHVKFEDYKNMLRPVIGDQLSVRIGKGARGTVMGEISGPVHAFGYERFTQLHTYFVGTLPRPYERSVVSNTFMFDQRILEKTLKFALGEWLLSSYIARNRKCTYIH